jgi:DNA-directed RNA polymerase subunit RPC12/RpoP
MKEVTVTLEFPVEKKFRCTECGEVSDEYADGPVYECRECSELFLREEGGGRNGNLSPCCNKMSSKAHDENKVCMDCKQPVEEADLVLISEEWIETDEVESKVHELVGM